MFNLTIIENGLVPVYEGKNRQLVNARELHEFLEVGKDFTSWIKDRIEKYGFIENENFSVFTENGENPIGGRPKTEYILTLDTAKEIAMVQNNEKGSSARKYFIAVEKKLKELTKPQCLEDVLIAQLQEMKALRQQVNEANHNALRANLGAEEAKQQVQAIRAVVAINANAWRSEIQNLLNKIAIQRGGTSEAYREVREESYKLLDERAGAKLSIRLTNRRRKVLEETGSKSKADKVSKLDVIAEDKRLTEVYLAIVKDMALRYKIA